MGVAIEVKDISKQFRLYNEKHTSLKERVIHGGKMPFTPFWALRDVNVDINQGETFGILGRNGCGKSTLLKCVAGILKPTTGEIRVRGSLAAMLELGAGFQPDLSGRDNIFLNGSLLGLSRSEIEKRFDDIVAFAELEDFIDNQVKFYSSGMYVRLGFAVAVNVEPDVLLVDEVLAVGDAAFQRKCLDHVKKFQREGRTIVVVSHGPDTIRQNCERAMVMNHGKVITVDEPGEAIRVYLADLLGVGTLEGLGVGRDRGERAGHRHGAGRARRQRTADPHVPRRVADRHRRPGQPGCRFPTPWPPSPSTTTRTSWSSPPIPTTRAARWTSPRAGAIVRFYFPEVPLLDGTYSVSVGVRSATETAIFDWKDQVTQFEVANPGRSTGRVRLPLDVSFRLRSTGLTGEVPAVGADFGPLAGWEENAS